MLLTVAEALELSSLRTAKVVAGTRNLNNVIKYVDTMEVPDLRPWMRSDELLITTGYVIRDDTQALENLVENLAQARAAGMMLKTARFLGAIPRSVIELAESVGLPLIEVPKETPFIDITHSIMQEIVRRQTRYLEHSNAVWKLLTTLELQGAGLNTIATALASLVGNEVAIMGPDWQLMAWGAPSSLGSTVPPSEVSGLNPIRKSSHTPEWLVIPEDLRQRLYRETTIVKASLANDLGWCRIRAVSVRGKTVAYVAVRETARSLDEMDLVALEHTATTVALEMIRVQALEDMRKRMELDFFEDLLLGKVPNREIALQRSRTLGYPVRQVMTVMILRVDNPTFGPDGISSDVVRAILDRNTRLMSSSQRPTLIPRNDNVVCLFPISDRGAAKRESVSAAMTFLGSIRDEIPSLSVSVGISSVCQDLMEVAAKYREASQALEITRIVQGNGSIGCIEDLSPYRFLLEHPNRSQMEDFHSTVLGVLRKYDQDNGTNLMKVLRVSLMTSSRQEAAQRLHVHRNTLSARLKQIEEVLGRSLEDPEDVFILSLGVRVGLFLSPPSQGT